VNIYISADMEGLTGVTVFKEVKEDEEDYSRFRKIMTKEVNAAIRGALEVTSARILVNDSHAGMRNLLIEDLHPSAQLISGNIKDRSMMEGLDESFDAVFCIGYHAMSGTAGAVRAHTFSDEIYSVKINGQEVGELGMSSYYAGSLGVPVALVTGDDKLVSEARSLLGEVKTVTVKQGISAGSAIHNPLSENEELIQEKAREAAEEVEKFDPLAVKRDGTITIAFKHIEATESVKRFPFVKHIDGYTVQIEYQNYKEGFGDLLSVLKAV